MQHSISSEMDLSTIKALDSIDDMQTKVYEEILMLLASRGDEETHLDWTKQMFTAMVILFRS
jgi:hypothetical protein